MALQREIETAKNLFTKKLYHSRESKEEMLRILKKVINNIENGLTEDDVSFEKFLINIKEADRVLNNSALCTKALGSGGKLEAGESLVTRLNEQTSFMRKEIENFDQLKISSLRDIKNDEKIIKKHLKEICYNILAYHPETFKVPKRAHKFSILTSNQASALYEIEKPIKRPSSRPLPEETEPSFHRTSKSMSKAYDTKSKLNTTMPTVREYSEGDTLRRSMTISSQTKHKNTKRDKEILQLSQKIRINTLNFCGKQGEGTLLQNKIQKISKLMDYTNLKMCDGVLHLAQDRTNRIKQLKRCRKGSRSVAK
ncbi:unnamed protein product [Moneuplotes crassus]|uniref:Uncharacterized protein n=1 Tax=Euplotes crassus TaxID=5936 RepID=A0AAD1XHA5_EUPCR|nr:unnamed protein product [Moneuplotes crassus]